MSEITSAALTRTCTTCGGAGTTQPTATAVLVLDRVKQLAAEHETITSRSVYELMPTRWRRTHVIGNVNNALTTMAERQLLQRGPRIRSGYTWVVAE